MYRWFKSGMKYETHNKLDVCKKRKHECFWLTKAAGFRKSSGKQASPQYHKKRNEKFELLGTTRHAPVLWHLTHASCGRSVDSVDAAYRQQRDCRSAAGRGSGATPGRLAHGTRAPGNRLSLTDPSHQATSSGRYEKYSAFGPGGKQRRKVWRNWEQVCLLAPSLRETVLRVSSLDHVTLPVF
jgi:hypothetical protein